MNVPQISKQVKYDNFNLDALIKEIIYSEIFYRSIIIVFNNFYDFNQLVKRSSPVLVCLFNHFSILGKLCAKLCRIQKIPTIYIPHSAIPIISEMLDETDINYITVPGVNDKEYFCKLRVPSDNILETGRACYESFYENKVKDVTEVVDIFNNRRFTFNSEKFVILFTTNNIDDKSNEKLITLVINSVKKLDLIDNLIIKLHPAENGQVHKKVFEGLKVNPVIIKDYNILDLINSSDLLLSRKSTTLLEAMLLGKPIIVLDFINLAFSFTSKYQFLEDKNIISIKDQKKLTEKIKQLINNRDFYDKYSEQLRENSTNYNFYDKNEKPTQKTVNLIYRVIENNKSKIE